MKCLASVMILVATGQIALAQNELPDDVKRALPAGVTPTASARPAVPAVTKAATAINKAAPTVAPTSEESLDQKWNDALTRYQNIAAQANDDRWEAEVLERLERLSAAIKAEQVQRRPVVKEEPQLPAPVAALPPASIAQAPADPDAPTAPSLPRASKETPAAQVSPIPANHEPALARPATIPATVPDHLTGSSRIVARKPNVASAQAQVESLEALADHCDELAAILRQAAAGLRTQQTTEGASSR